MVDLMKGTFRKILSENKIPPKKQIKAFIRKIILFLHFNPRAIYEKMKEAQSQCDQIGGFIRLWETF